MKSGASHSSAGHEQLDKTGKATGSSPRSPTGRTSWRLMCGERNYRARHLPARLHDWQLAGTHVIAMIIGGDLGLSDAVLSRADLRLSISPMTFTHQMVRLILLEQMYRTCRINSGEPYHK